MTIVITIIFCLSLMTFFAISCTKQYKKPTHRLDDLLQLETRLSNTGTKGIEGHDASAAQGGDALQGVGAKLRTWATRMTASIKGGSA